MKKIEEYFLFQLENIFMDYPDFVEGLFSADGIEYEYNNTADYEDLIYENYNVIIKHGGTKLVFIFYTNNDIAKHYVVKIPFASETNYCDIEVKNYMEICNKYNEYKKYFAECWHAADIGVFDRDGFERNIPIYIMERADVDESEVSARSYSYINCNCNSDDDYFLYLEEDEEVMNCFMESYNIEEGRNVFSIFEEIGINDIHKGNIGFKNNYPVIIDYSGYYG